MSKTPPCQVCKGPTYVGAKGEVFVSISILCKGCDRSPDLCTCKKKG